MLDWKTRRLPVRAEPLSDLYKTGKIINTHTHTHTHTEKHRLTDTHRHRHTHTRTHTRTHARTHARTHTHTQTHTYMLGLFVAFTVLLVLKPFRALTASVDSYAEINSAPSMT